MITAKPPVVTVPALDLPGIAHGFLTRRGGVSTGDLASLNCGPGSGDDPARIAANRRAGADAVLPGAALLGVYQVHGRDCVVAHGADAWGDQDRPHADALATRVPGVLLAVLTADCVPVLMADPDAGVVGAAHAGWKGALSGVTDATIAAMVQLGARPDRIRAAIGPCIGRASYEVDAAFADRFIADDADNAHFFTDGRREGHAMFDIAAYAAHRLRAGGVATVAMVDHDTCAMADAYFSYRRATLAGEPGYGRQMSVIGLLAP